MRTLSRALPYIMAAILIAAISTSAQAMDFTVTDTDATEYAAEADLPAGLWRMTDGGAVFAIEAIAGSQDYRLVLLDSPDWQIEPGTMFGTMRPTAVKGKYNASLLKKPGDTSSKSRDYIFEISDDGDRITFSHYNRTHTLRADRWLRYLFRITLRSPDRPEGTDGALRLGSRPTITL